jgi:hypothetical protein
VNVPNSTLVNILKYPLLQAGVRRLIITAHAGSFLMRYLSMILLTLLLAIPAWSVELFRYRGAAKDGGTLEYVFEAGEQNSPNAVSSGIVPAGP